MLKLSETELLARDAQRDLNAELLDSIAQIKAGKVGRVSLVTRDGRVIACCKGAHHFKAVAVAVCRTYGCVGTHIAGVGAGAAQSFRGGQNAVACC